MCGLQGMGVEVWTAAVVMDIQTAFTPSQSVQQQNMAHPHGILNTVHQPWLPPLAVGVMT